MKDRTADAADDDVYPRLPDLILVWLTATRKSHRIPAMREQLYPFVDKRLGTADWRSRLDDTLEQLVQEARVVRSGPSTVLLTEKGQLAALSALGVDSLPSTVRWSTLVSQWLSARAVHPDGKVSREALMRVRETAHLAVDVIAAGQHSGKGRTPNGTLDGFFWGQIGEERGDPFTLSKVKRVLLERILGNSTSRAPLHSLVRQLAAKEVGAHTGRDLRKAAIRRWLEMPREPEVRERAGPPETWPEEDFVNAVHEAARTARSGRFGDRKVYVAHVYRRLAEMGYPGGNLAAFKKRLLEAHRVQKIALSPGDLVQAMSKTDLAESAIPHKQSTYHFVEVDALPVSQPAKVINK